MSLVVANGAIIGDPNTYDYWDPSLSRNPGAASQDNRGCAPGWACIYVEDSVTGGTVKVCRKLDEAILGPGGSAIIQEETAPNWTDQAVINVAETSQEIVSGAAGVIGAVTPAIGMTGILLIGAALLLFAWKK